MVAMGGSKSTVRTDEQTQAALLWWATGELWFQPARKFIIEQGMDVLRAAQVLALLGATSADVTLRADSQAIECRLDRREFALKSCSPVTVGERRLYGRPIWHIR
jgi:hypothetical protein